MKKIIKENPAVIMIISMFISTIGVTYFDIGTSLLGMIPNRLILGISIFGIMYIIIGKEVFIWQKKSGRYAFTRSICFLSYNCILSIVILFALHSSNKLVDDWIYNVIVCLLLSLCVGFFEECLFRGIIVNGMVKIMPKTKSGVYSAIIISSFIFAAVHVYRYIPDIMKNPTSILVQMIYKIIILQISGMLLSVIYLKTKNIWVCMIIHAMFDFVAIAVLSVLGMGIPSSINIHKIITLQKLIPYLFSIACVLPNLIIAIMIMKKLKPEECVIWK